MSLYQRARYHANLHMENEMTDYLPVIGGMDYNIRVDQKFFGSRITVQILRDDDYRREIVGSLIQYPTLAAFFVDWQPRQILPDPFLSKTIQGES